MKSAVFALLAGACQAGDIAVTWADCGKDTHGHITDLQPTKIKTGEDQTITGTGNVDEDVAGGTFKFTVKAGWLTVLSDSGDICEPKKMDIKAMGMSLGFVSWGGMKCPLAKGTMSVPMTIHLSSSIPSSLARTTMDATAVATNGDKLLCLSSSTAPAAAVAVPAPWVSDSLKTTGSRIKLTWADCGGGSTHGTIKDVEPTTISTGEDQTVTGTGSVDEDVAGGTFKFTVKAGWFTVLSESGDICKPKTMDIKAMGMSLGTVSWEGMKCPLAKGTMSVPMTIHLSSSIPSSLARTTMDATAVATNGDKLLCMSTTTAPAADVLV